MALTFDDFQGLIDRMYGEKDRARGSTATFLWLCEEVGELAAAIREGTHAEKEGEFADVLAWLSTLASIAGIDLQAAAARKYAEGCPRCHATPCACG